MATACRGVIPTARNTPRSRARSRVCRITVPTTPSAAAIASSSTRVPVRMIMYGTGDPVVSRWPVAKPPGSLAPMSWE